MKQDNNPTTPSINADNNKALGVVHGYATILDDVDGIVMVSFPVKNPREDAPESMNALVALRQCFLERGLNPVENETTHTHVAQGALVLNFSAADAGRVKRAIEGEGGKNDVGSINHANMVQNEERNARLATIRGKSQVGGKGK